jgi:branched-chain amino acid transport system ATP-binding protein
MPDQVPVLRLDHVSKSFGGVHAVSDASLTVLGGERRALIGPNGAGKTTLFNLVAGALPVDRGVITMFGETVTRWPMHRRAQLGLGRTYQTSQLFGELTVEENLLLATLGGKGTRLPMLASWRGRGEDRAWVAEVARQVGLAGRLQEKVSAISHGEQRQLEIGMALAMRPRLVMLDEPSSGLSPGERVVITELIHRLPKDLTVVLIEHHMELALGVADRVTVLHRGAVISEGTPDDIRADHEVQAVYLGAQRV